MKINVTLMGGLIIRNLSRYKLHIWSRPHLSRSPSAPPRHQRNSVFRTSCLRIQPAGQQRICSLFGGHFMQTFGWKFIFTHTTLGKYVLFWANLQAASHHSLTSWLPVPGGCIFCLQDRHWLLHDNVWCHGNCGARYTDTEILVTWQPARSQILKREH